MAKEKQKICSHCEGRISVEADTCLYCGMPLVEIVSPPAQSIQETISPTYAPLYSQKETGLAAKFKTAPQKEDAFAGIGIPQSATEAIATQENEADKSSYLALVLSLLGSSMLVLGLMQGLFSDDGILRLEWNCRYWFLFCLLSFPMLYFGIKKSKI